MRLPAKRCPGKPIQAVIGGFHLNAETQPTVFGVGKALLEMEIPEVYTGHCTGEMQTDILAEVLGEAAAPAAYRDGDGILSESDHDEMRLLRDGG